MDLSKINTVIASGGGIRSFCFIGFFKSFLQLIDIKQIKHFVGTSAGALFSLCIVLGYSLDEITKILFKYDFNKIIPSFSNSIDELFLNYGLSDGAEMKKFIYDLIEYKIGKDKLDITFLELYELTGLKLTITVTNFTLQTVEYWNYENTPSNLIIDGIMATVRVPLVFTPLEINNMHYLDGGLVNNYPIDFIPLEEIDTVIGVCLTSKKNTDEIKSLFKN